MRQIKLLGISHTRSQLFVLYTQLKIELTGLDEGEKMTLVVQHFINIYILFMGSGDILNTVSTWNSISSTKKSKNRLVSCAFSFSFPSNNSEVLLQII